MITIEISNNGNNLLIYAYRIRNGDREALSPEQLQMVLSDLAAQVFAVERLIKLIKNE